EIAPATFATHEGGTSSVRASGSNGRYGSGRDWTDSIMRPAADMLPAADFVLWLLKLLRLGLGRSLGFVTINDKLVADLGTAAEDGMSGQFQNTLSLVIWHGNAERAHEFAQSHHLEVLVQKNEVEREQHADGVDGVSRHDPAAAIRWE